MFQLFDRWNLLGAGNDGLFRPNIGNLGIGTVPSGLGQMGNLNLQNLQNLQKSLPVVVTKHIVVEKPVPVFIEKVEFYCSKKILT